MKSNSSSFDVPPNTLPPEPPKSFLYRNVQRSPQKSIQSTLIDFESASVKDQTYHEQVSYDVPVITPKFLVQQKTNRVRRFIWTKIWYLKQYLNSVYFYVLFFFRFPKIKQKI